MYRFRDIKRFGNFCLRTELVTRLSTIGRLLHEHNHIKTRTGTGVVAEDGINLLGIVSYCHSVYQLIEAVDSFVCSL